MVSSFFHAFRGIRFALMSQRNMRIHCFAGFVAVCFAVFFKFSILEWLALLLTITLVLVAEFFNTAIEITIDLVTKKRKYRAMLSKDIAAGGVLVASVNALIVGYLLFYSRFVNLIHHFYTLGGQ